MIRKLLHRIQINLIWKKKNKNNATWIGNISNLKFRDFILNDGITVGKGTYGQINVNYTLNRNEKLIIGEYCSIATTVRFVLGGEHDYRCISTYPFLSKIGHYETEVISKGPIILEDEVWLGENVTILSGVHIGRGAVVAAGSVVVKDIPAYSIYGGNPARLIKMRFSREIINKLEKYKLNINNIDEQMKWIFETHLTEENVDKVIKALNDKEKTNG